MRVAVAGLGFGAQVHIPGWRQVDGCEVIGVCASRIEKAREVAVKLGGNNQALIQPCATIEELIALKPDVVSLALPPKISERAIELCLQNKIPVLAEKPLAASSAKACYLADLAKKQGVANCIDFQFAELPAFKKVRQLLPTLGPLKKISVDWQLESFAMNARLASWKLDKTQGGGVLNVLGSHFLFLLNSIVSSEFKLTHAKSTNLVTSTFMPAELAAEDCIELKYEGKNLPHVSAIISNSNPAGKGHRWEFISATHQLVLHNPTKDYMAGFTIEMGELGSSPRRVYEDSSSSNADGRLAPFASLARRFKAQIEKPSKDFCPTFEHGARVQLMMEEILSH